MLIQAVDFAASAWASCLVRGGEVVHETSAHYARTERLAVEALSLPWMSSERVVVEEPAVMLLEDVPHQMRFDTITKAVVRMQGRVVQRMDELGQLDKILFVPPALWQRGFTKLGFPDGKELWKSRPERYAEFAKKWFDYEPPNLVELHKADYAELHGKERQDVRGRLKKLMGDYVDAYLIARWYELLVEQTGDTEPKSSQRYLR